jgi:hypothetical protein
MVFGNNNEAYTTPLDVSVIEGRKGPISERFL